MRVAIIGAGISGLAAAYDLDKQGGFEVSLFEKDSKPGGKIQTVYEESYLVEQGPDSIFSAKPWANQLMAEIGIDQELVEPQTAEFSILSKGKLHAVPRALAGLIPSASGVLEKVGFLTSAAKKRALKEHSVTSSATGDESVASFFRRRLGRSFSEMVAEPLLAGTHAGNPERLSMAALYPTYLGMEREHGSLSKAAEARAATSGAPRKAGFLTLRDGMATFPEALVRELKSVDLHWGTDVSSISIQGEGAVVKFGGEERLFDKVILSIPAYASAKLLERMTPQLAEELRQICFVSTAIVTLAYPRSAFSKSLHGSGFLVPYHEKSALTGCTWSSNKWADRAPEDMLLIRAFMGRDGGMDVDSCTDDELIRAATEALSEILSPKVGPSYTLVKRWTRAMAQYELGHLDRLKEIDRHLEGLPIHLIGSSYRGNSIPDCVLQGRSIAQKLITEATRVVNCSA